MTRHVLVVDDEDSITLSLRHLMKREGYRVTVARDGDEALAAVAAGPPDLLLLDVMIPKRDGYDVCQTIKANPAWAGVKIVMVSARGRDIEVEKGLALGADAYVTKPFSTRELAQMVRDLIGAPDA
ncbi:MAG: two-component system response regulator [Alphaproteobacteria bacterium HGW-Alphaproteobacteria-8]|nr:MAG: two-component system response regulator [Alphaproteobacteria bacterium HGW-Alphaproteobacteria-8]